ncbi:RNA-binding S4 domain-containing protein [Enterovirga aerilata]|uniref:RNA-binding S4 domain-containing protein n=1 Tax=Enterovirga aerilata TaxID=2730920 RepID=A0A849I5J2_9HYPH|nr:RNA-binding S4 domain-containing protein [Enterovirga sp. DB1703]NNM71669.1 RNA-binding S4 domain-containing protein [Enterovirga sp. DB1703]
MREGRQRLDKWLWFARFARTRTLAAKLVTQGAVRVNGVRTEAPARLVGAGDVLTIAAQHVTAVVRVLAAGERRGPAPEARLLYEDVGRDDAALVTSRTSG